MYICTSVTGSPEARCGIPVDLTCHKERAHCGHTVISQGQGGITITRPRSFEQPGPGAHGWATTELCLILTTTPGQVQASGEQQW